MPILEEAVRIEESLMDQFQDSLENLYEAEEEAKEDFIGFIYGPEIEE